MLKVEGCAKAGRTIIRAQKWHVGINARKEA
jgi:hypothetical protein